MNTSTISGLLLKSWPITSINACVHLCVFQLTLIDMIIYGALEAANCYSVRWSRVLRPLLLINVTEGRQARTWMQQLVAMLWLQLLHIKSVTIHLLVFQLLNGSVHNFVFFLKGLVPVSDKTWNSVWLKKIKNKINSVDKYSKMVEWHSL